MKNQTSFLNLIALSAMSAATAFAQPPAKTAPATPVPGYQADYQYQVANVDSVEEAQRLMDYETADTAKNSICANRAETWVYTMNRFTGAKIGKIFIHFTSESEPKENKAWAYHVAPYVLVKGEVYVLDKGFGVFQGHPAKLSDWTQYFSKSDTCRELDPVNNPADLALEQHNLPNDWTTPDKAKGSPRQYPILNGNICYTRKTPMYYIYPMQVYGADLNLAGQSQYSNFMRYGFDKDEVVSSCKQAMSFFAKLSVSCPKYLGYEPMN